MRKLVFGILLLPAMLAPAAPRLPYYDWGACPFEGCTYREWTSNKPIMVYNMWQQGRKTIAQLPAGEKVSGVTGVVITFRPGTIRMDRDLPEQNLKRGEIILTYAYRGEGFAAVWFRGRYNSSFDVSFAKRSDGPGCAPTYCAATYLDLGKKEWWAQVKLKSGLFGWIDMDEGPFDGVDQLARSNAAECRICS